MRAWRWIALTFIIVVVFDATIDMGKWAIGRYTNTGILLSFIILLAGSAALALMFEVMHRWRLRLDRVYEQYEHHGFKIWVRRDIRGKHWNSTICLDCGDYHPQTEINCAIAEALFTVCKEKHLALGIFECPKFRR